MAWTSATPQTTVEATRELAIQFTQAIELYIQTNSPGLLATANTLATNLKNSITTLQT